MPSARDRETWTSNDPRPHKSKPYYIKPVCDGTSCEHPLDPTFITAIYKTGGYLTIPAGKKYFNIYFEHIPTTDEESSFLGIVRSCGIMRMQQFVCLMASRMAEILVIHLFNRRIVL